MKRISVNPKENADTSIWAEVEKNFNIAVRKDIKDFFAVNAGGRPTRNIIVVQGEEYEVRIFLSLDAQDQYYYIKKPLLNFLQRTKGRIIPIGIDSGDNYYCVNNENGKVYYWSAEPDEYYCIADNLEMFINLFE
ncbi:SMI1/KNR4 family protein [Agathobaculum sp. Marseille-P7918]|uniref:SMI1/KNR4 family protein n=1 Tax=Agathobaculum sp. Marseille-P7918 TaxID=2479843 RepID=UPI000F645135|nr:SMI1/KNR4 family protein [Agathobaculum sp. Marseille-P7918]